MSFSWQEMLDRADSEDRVLAVAREYLDRLEPAEIAKLPESCKPSGIHSASDVSIYALALARYHSDKYDETSALINRMAAFFVHANIRLANLLARTNDDDESIEGLA